MTEKSIEERHGKVSSQKKFMFIVATIVIAYILISPEDITWAKDRLSYLVYAESSGLIAQRYLSNSLFSLFSNEPLFLGINIMLATIFSSENVINFIIMFSTIGVLLSLGKISKYDFWILFFFMFIPQILKNHITHLRQGLALSIYLIGLVSTKKYLKSLKFFAVFIHTSIVFLLFFEYLDKFFDWLKFNFKLKVLCSVGIFSLLIWVMPKLALLIGDRRAGEYSFQIDESASGLGLLLWIVAGTIFILTMKKDKLTLLCCYGIIFYILSYFSLNFGARIFENILPLIVVVALKDERKMIRIFFICFFLLYGSIQWYSKGGMNF